MGNDRLRSAEYYIARVWVFFQLCALQTIYMESMRRKMIFLLTPKHATKLLLPSLRPHTSSFYPQ